MKILVIGGSRFVGYYMVDAALRNGHEVTMFNRGQSNPGIFPDVEEIHGDRNNDLHLLEGRQWDAVIDTCGYVPRVVEASATALKEAAETYCFISTVSVYDDDQADEITEETRVGTLEDETVEEISGGTYGPLKVLCEKVTEKYFPQRALNVRCGLIVGPRDPTNRFGYWVKHLHKSSEILAPSGPDLSLQIIDVRDLADSTIRMIEAKKAGIYNFVGPRDPITLPEVLNRIKAELKTDANFVWVDDQFLVEHEVVPWGGLPLWLPPPDNGVMRVSAKKAIGDGLTYRPLEDTIRHSFEWLHEADDVDPNKRAPGQISAEREAELINLWRAKQQA